MSDGGIKLDIKPVEVFKWFEEISKIPRCSGDEKRISDFLVDFARERELEWIQDEELNIVIKKSGSSGYENSDAVIIQGHMDMVCEKSADSKHDFSKDPIKLIFEGDDLRADKTTLGADNGIAVAYGLAVLDSDNLKHPPIELLVTTNEETGMDGAAGVNGDNLSGKTLLNIDSEEEGVFLVSCAGGANNLISFKVDSVKNSDQGYRIKIRGLKGGHSGMEIINQRANAIKILARILYELKSNIDFRLSYIDGGSKHNAIPNYAEAIVATKDAEKLNEIIDYMILSLKKEYEVQDPDMEIVVEKADMENVFEDEVAGNIIDFLMMAPDGVQSMSEEIDNLVQTSLNVGVLTLDDGVVNITVSIRSASESSLLEIQNKLKIMADRSNADYKITNSYPAWEYEKDSKVRDLSIKIYEELTGKKAEIGSIHAGLECGILKRALPEADMISFGPNIYDVHTANENLSISSVENVWKFLVKLLEELK
ncbi:MAG: aminoacyl-histidine dipeptidase [Tissierellia bacterium]|nr:aminoacyl-histidine dipeptidase [Tissierellia bacterium]